MSEALFPFRHPMTADEAVSLFKLVANSPHTNGLVTVYQALAELVEDEDRVIPGNLNYKGPRWRNGCYYCGGDDVRGHRGQCLVTRKDSA